MATTPNMLLPLLDSAQLQKEVQLNACFTIVDTLTTRKTGDTLTGALKLTRAAVATGNPAPDWWVVAPADTGLTASTEAVSVLYDLSASRQFAAGGLTNQRAMRILAPTYRFVSASTLATAATLAISGAPLAGTNATLTNSYALWVEAGLTNLAGGLVASSHLWTVTSNNASSTGAHTVSTDTGRVNLGGGGFAGGGAPQFAGSGSGTVLAVNEGAGYVGNLADWQIAGVTKFKVSQAGDLTVLGGCVLKAVSFTGHLSGAGGSAPTAVAGGGAGTAPPAPVVAAGSNDTRGTITWGTGTGAIAGDQVDVTFAAAYATTPVVFVQPIDNTMTSLQWSIANRGTTGFTLWTAVAPASSQANTAFKFYYWIVQ